MAENDDDDIFTLGTSEAPYPIQLYIFMCVCLCVCVCVVFSAVSKWPS